MGSLGVVVNRPELIVGGFTLQPFGFFDRNPALDVPPAASRHSCDARPPAE